MEGIKLRPKSTSTRFQDYIPHPRGSQRLVATALCWCSCLLMMCSVRGLVALATPARVSQDCKRRLGLSRPKQHAVCSLECMVSRYVLCFPQTTLGPLVHRNGLLVDSMVLAFFLATSRSCTNESYGPPVRWKCFFLFF